MADQINEATLNPRQVDQGANVHYNSENKRIETAKAPWVDTADIPKEDSENKRINADGTANVVEPVTP